ncbi:hypothetical protein ACSV5S_11150 [Agrobacterium deltaense]|uniref:hypothetical protein n=1 Tax=Agrobacterium deltaense TaxID=1183412 RepID=UPI003FD5CDFC
MIDKVGHIKNPLTVIAMFAALAEVSGTAVLPFVGEDAQLFYVKFLSLFPCLIVGLFFYTLWKYPRNLYAPSDYSNENNFVSALGFLVAKKTEQEIEEAGAMIEGSVTLTADATVESATSLMVGGETADGSTSTAESAEEQWHKVGKAVEETQDSDRKTWMLYHRQLLDRVTQATNWVIRELTLENQTAFVRNVSPSGQPSIVFDAVGNDNGFTIVVEVKYASNPRFNTAVFSKSIKDARAYYDTLPEERRKQFGLILALVVDEKLSLDDIEKLRRRLRDRARHEETDFTVQVKVFSYRELSDAYSTS